MEITMAALVILLAIVGISGILFGGFATVCWRIGRTDKRGSLRPEALSPQRHHLLAYAARWDDNTPAFT
jgi:hypothetical protein